MESVLVVGIVGLSIGVSVFAAETPLHASRVRAQSDGNDECSQEKKQDDVKYVEYYEGKGRITRVPRSSIEHKCVQKLPSGALMVNGRYVNREDYYLVALDSGELVMALTVSQNLLRERRRSEE